jgi:hypothetical protein
MKNGKMIYDDDIDSAIQVYNESMNK